MSTVPTAPNTRVEVAVADLRLAGGVMLGAGVLWPLHPAGFAIPCGFLAVTGVPCPLCGMTRSVTATVHLDIGAALAANPAGIVAVLVAIALLIRPPARLTGPSWAVPVGLAALWSCQLLRLLFV